MGADGSRGAVGCSACTQHGTESATGWRDATCAGAAPPGHCCCGGCKIDAESDSGEACSSHVARQAGRGYSPLDWVVGLPATSAAHPPQLVLLQMRHRLPVFLMAQSVASSALRYRADRWLRAAAVRQTAVALCSSRGTAQRRAQNSHHAH